MQNLLIQNNVNDHLHDLGVGVDVLVGVCLPALSTWPSASWPCNRDR